ncbi:hypothetical protein EZJ19_12985 [Parasulfuritortus cantonensis]|uniref:NADH:quinone oxidoreductase/Mrp antiporter membrane subunit domain-containing protein n=1 Tax=Parasulfuritortus cantonensis TaxID=2528202 RepID=A0A4R1B461_9PROT|nr:hypothetical protein [Parasulfuritortus cantonensis]TCJ12250.1 hypothetical protein EZJ19_12985 [Parasulfuritortus cantonensis]
MTLLLIAALFLPLYPLSVPLNALLARVRSPVARFVLLLIWPQVGVAVLAQAGTAVPSWLVGWALFTAALYALRLLTCRDLGRAAGYLATSAIALTWGLAASASGIEQVALFALWMSLPAALTTLLDGMLVRRFGAAYAGLCPGLGSALPRYAGLLVVTVLAAVATPPFPGFFALLGLMHGLGSSAAVVVLLIWLVWAWAAVRLLQGFVAGTCREEGIEDLQPGSVLAWVGVLAAFVGAGFFFTGGGL